MFPIFFSFFFFFLLLRSVNKLSIKRQQKQTGKRNTATIFSYEVIVGSDGNGDGDRGTDAATRGLFIKSNNSNTFVGNFEVKFFGENCPKAEKSKKKKKKEKKKMKRQKKKNNMN